MTLDRGSRNQNPDDLPLQEGGGVPSEIWLREIEQAPGRSRVSRKAVPQLSVGRLSDHEQCGTANRIFLIETPSQRVSK